MTRFVRIVALVSGLLLVALVSGTFLRDYGVRGFAVPLGAALGTLIAMLASHAFFRRVMLGGASIVGGMVGSAVSGTAVGESGVLMAPYLVFMGSVLGGAVWIVTLSIVPFNSERKLWRLLGICKHLTDGREKTPEYLLVSLGSFVIGPVLGLAYFLIEYLAGNIAVVDEWPVFGYAIRGPVGALLCATSFGATGGLLFAVPYFLAWLIQIAAQGPGKQSCDVDEDSNKQVAK
jgi:lysylphosphatidylglycerol synthetase-like protein (DUF2156 family)